MRREFVRARFAAVFATRQIAWSVIHVPQVCLSGLPAGRSASKCSTLHCAVETQVPIAAQGTLIEMARAQGEGFVRATACRVLDMVCEREGATWKIKTLVMHEA
jgi:hypothetical protein